MLRPHRKQRASDLLDRGVFSLRNPLLAASLPDSCSSSWSHHACALGEMTMAAATHARPALQLQQSRKLSSHTPNKHCSEPARADSRGSLLALSHLVAHTRTHPLRRPCSCLVGRCTAAHTHPGWRPKHQNNLLGYGHDNIPPSHTLRPRSQPAPSGSRRLWH
jgi:hypothetical protein